MCMEDYRIARDSGAQARIMQSDGTLPLLIAGSDLKRTRIILSTDGIGKGFVGVKGAMPGNDLGFILPVTHPTMIFRVEDFGSLMWQEWYVHSDSTPMNWWVTLVSLERT